MVQKKRPSDIYQRAAQQLADVDPVFGRVLSSVGSCGLRKELKPTATTFEALLEAITHQQLSTKPRRQYMAGWMCCLPRI